MYVAEGDKVYLKQIGGNGQELELFLTVHPADTGSTMTVEAQARILATILNFTEGTPQGMPK